MIVALIVGVVLALWLFANTLAWLSLQGGRAPGGYPWNWRIYTKGPWYVDWAWDRDPNGPVGFWS